MSEMSREEAIDILKDVVMNTDKLNKDGAPIEVVNAMLKGIEELEKLEKIEEIVDEMWDENSYYNNTVRFAEKIEQIVRGEKNKNRRRLVE